MTTLRDVGAIGIKLMGLYFASRVVALYVGLMVMPLVLSTDAFSAGDPLLATSISGAAGSLAVSLIGLLAAHPIASALFPPTPLSLGMSRQDALVVGVAIVGVWLAADAGPAVVGELAGAVGLARQGVPSGSFERAWPRVFEDAVTCATGVAVAVTARRVAGWLDRA